MDKIDLFLLFYKSGQSRPLQWCNVDENTISCSRVQISVRELSLFWIFFCAQIQERAPTFVFL